MNAVSQLARRVLKVQARPVTRVVPDACRGRGPPMPKSAQWLPELLRIGEVAPAMHCFRRCCSDCVRRNITFDQMQLSTFVAAKSRISSRVNHWTDIESTNGVPPKTKPSRPIRRRIALVKSLPGCENTSLPAQAWQIVNTINFCQLNPHVFPANLYL